jgi:hypothetical protein
MGNCTNGECNWSVDESPTCAEVEDQVASPTHCEQRYRLPKRRVNVFTEEPLSGAVYSQLERNKIGFSARLCSSYRSVIAARADGKPHLQTQR